MTIELAEEKKDAAGRDHSTYSVNGEGAYGKSDVALRVVELILPELLKTMSLAEAVAYLNKQLDSKKRQLLFEDNQTASRYNELSVKANGQTYKVYVDNGWNAEDFPNFINKVHTNFKDFESGAVPSAPVKDSQASAEAEKAAAEKAKKEAEQAKAAAEKAKVEAEKAAAEKAKAEAEKVAAEKAKAAAEKAQAEAEKLKLETEKAALDKLKAETEKAKAELAAAEKMKAELEKAKAEAEKARAAAEKANEEASKAAESGTSKKKDPFFADMVKVEGTFTDFYISKYQVTQAQWFAVMGNNPSKFQSNNNPVEMVSWEDCQLFLKKLNELTGKKYRLPTSGEWQFAASGGQKSKNYKYAGSNNLSDVAWYESNSGGTTHPVGQKQPNELGLYDMSGNVWEWCEDWSDEKKTYRVGRGGSWGGSAGNCECSYRSYGTPSYRGRNFGFRLAL